MKRAEREKRNLKNKSLLLDTLKDEVINRCTKLIIIKLVRKMQSVQNYCQIRETFVFAKIKIQETK